MLVGDPTLKDETKGIFVERDTQDNTQKHSRRVMRSRGYTHSSLLTKRFGCPRSITASFIIELIHSGNYYMIPERNLIAASELSNEQQLLWVRIITDMMEEGPRLLLRLKTFRQAIVGYPEPLIWYSKMRTEMEMWMLELYNRLMEIMDTNSMVDETDTIVQTCRKRTTKIRRGVCGVWIWRAVQFMVYI
ncbi:hypothetical protein DPMN_028000 [Dreissena polymorpha]|uniref:Uncharacterized protein n=1 Tax=Dreissena polymorpha TaxID=45954 RepID=A0A9D4LTW6_DREPO|nr:hypothetical protein DPMN_028000 [Dreissena polymorpha]